MQIYFATTNSGKVSSLQRDLEDYGILVIQKPIELDEPRSSEVKDIAEHKVFQAYYRIKKPTVVNDAGFYIDSLKGFPRAFANFALETIGLEGILRLAEGKSRGCEFRECLAYLDDRVHEPVYFISHVRGSLSEAERGTLQKHHWSSLALIFIPDGESKTLGEMSYDEYLGWREISRRQTSAGRQLGEWLSLR